MLHVVLLIFFSFVLQTSTPGWELLSLVEITKEYDEFISAEIDKPLFPEKLKAQEGAKIVLEGFMIPLEQETRQEYFVLSRFPYQSCFFCGGAGPETVVEVFSDEKFTFTDNRIRVEGELELNDDNPLQLFYVLRNSKITKWP